LKLRQPMFQTREWGKRVQWESS